MGEANGSSIKLVIRLLPLSLLGLHISKPLILLKSILEGGDLPLHGVELMHAILHLARGHDDEISILEKETTAHESVSNLKRNREIEKERRS